MKNQVTGWHWLIKINHLVFRWIAWSPTPASGWTHGDLHIMKTVASKFHPGPRVRDAINGCLALEINGSWSNGSFAGLNSMDFLVIFSMTNNP